MPEPDVPVEKVMEIRHLDPKRWGAMHLPFGCLAGLLFAYVQLYSQSKTPSVPAILFTFAFCAVLFSLGAALFGMIQAMFMNFYMRVIDAGPIIRIRDLGTEVIPTDDPKYAPHADSRGRW